MAQRLLNSPSDPQRVIRALGLKRDAQMGLLTCLERIWAADSIVGLSHAHGRALGHSTGLGFAHAISRAQFSLLAEAYSRAFEHRLSVLTDQSSHSSVIGALRIQDGA